mmetsp:Transcript_5128/g.12286  ORF Transcript_5128/g.12286 Transcript_5128/m.12286 type:complete len:95 (-) Transcript_5128:1120-1404(-)
MAGYPHQAEGVKSPSGGQAVGIQDLLLGRRLCCDGEQELSHHMLRDPVGRSACCLCNYSRSPGVYIAFSVVRMAAPTAAGRAAKPGPPKAWQAC